jgi:hypothetical protein
LPPKPAPKAAIRGLTSKIKRFYWREIEFRRFELLEQHGVSSENLLSEALKDKIHSDALNDIKFLHATTPKYSLDTESESDFLARGRVEIVELRARVRNGGEVLRDDGTFGRPEQFAADWLAKNAFSAVKSESTPLHAIFAVLLWRLIQDCADPFVRNVKFGERSSFEGNGRSSHEIITALPRDFGTSAYAQRRAAEIVDFFERMLSNDRSDLMAVFDSGIEGSYGLRQYLWAHRPGDIARARQLLSVVPPEFIYRALKYLLDDYWGHYLGWPDLFAWRGDEFLFVEVKLSGDKLSEEQRLWIEQNASVLGLPFKIVKIHKLVDKAKQTH